MPSVIVYLVDAKGSDFVRLLATNRQPISTYIDSLSSSKEMDLWDGILSNDDTEFLVDLTGVWTLCSLPYPYSCLLIETKHNILREKVERWEQSLLELLPSNTIYRIDDSLFGEWDIRYDYLLVRFPKALQDFVLWLETQDRHYWTLLNAP